MMAYCIISTTQRNTTTRNDEEGIIIIICSKQRVGSTSFELEIFFSFLFFGMTVMRMDAMPYDDFFFFFFLLLLE